MLLIYVPEHLFILVDVVVKGRYNYEIIVLTMVTFLLALKLSNLILNRLKFQIISNYFFRHIIFLVVLESIRKKKSNTYCSGYLLLIYTLGLYVAPKPQHPYFIVLES